MLSGSQINERARTADSAILNIQYNTYFSVIFPIL